MSWIDAVDSAEFLNILFPDDAPSLARVRLFELRLDQDGPVVVLRFDLNDYPVNPPEKWKAAQSNTVQVQLMGIGIRTLDIKGWSTNNIGSLALQRTEHGVDVEFTSADCRIVASVDHLRLDKVSAYRDERL